jgi:hypothetical protein
VCALLPPRRMRPPSALPFKRSKALPNQRSVPLIPFDSKETNRLTTGVESTSENVTVDSPSFRSKNELGIGWTMLRQHCHGPPGSTLGTLR